MTDPRDDRTAALEAHVAKLEAGLRELRSGLPAEEPPAWQDEFGYRSSGNYGDVGYDAIACAEWEIAKKIDALLSKGNKDE